MLKSAARNMSAVPQIKHVTVIGAGLMGAGIVQVAAQAGYKVTMVDTSQTSIANGLKIIHSSLSRTAKKNAAKIVGLSQEQTLVKVNDYISKVTCNISTSVDAESAVKNTDLVVEAIVENLQIKRALFSTLDKHAPKSAIFASNTSSLPITSIATSTSQERQLQFAGLHFFNPVPQMNLVELISTSKISKETQNTLEGFSESLGKRVVGCKDTPGFIVNRLLIPYMFEALGMVERGDAKMADVDTAMKLGAGYPMGPFELMDYVGLDTVKFITDGWYNGDGILKGDSRCAPSKTLNDLVQKGELGRKSGKGFYEYPSTKK